MIGPERDGEACGVEGLHSIRGLDGHHYSIIRIKCSALSTTNPVLLERFNCRETISRLQFPELIGKANRGY